MSTPSTAVPSSVLKLAVIEGDGIGQEVVPQGLRALRAALEPVGVTVETTDFDLGAGRWHRTGETLTDEDMARLAEHDAILLGAVGDPGVPSGVLERGLLLKLRFAFDHYVNLRPTKLYPGVVSPLSDPGEMDFVVVREGTEGPYVGNGGTLRAGTELEVATEVSLNTAVGVERVVRYAFAQAEARGKKLTLVHKHNVLVHAGHLYRRIVEQVGAEHPEVTVDYAHVDAAMIYLATDPSRFDVIVTDNLFGDILTDLAGAVTGGIGLAPAGNINADRTAPSMFEPVHGSAPDIAGQQKANPVAAILATAMMLEHLGHSGPAARIEAAVQQDLAAHGNESRTTAQVGDGVLAALA